MTLKFEAYLILGLARECKLVLWLPIRDLIMIKASQTGREDKDPDMETTNLINPKPLIRRSDQPRLQPLHILDIIQPPSQGIVDINDNNFPVGLAFVEESHDTEDLDLFNLTGVSDGFADLADVERVVVASGFGLGVRDVGVLPGLWWSNCYSRLPENRDVGLTCGKAPGQKTYRRSMR